MMEKLSKSLSKCDKEVNSLLHEIEFWDKPFTQYNCLEWIIRLRDLLKTRREIKERMGFTKDENY